jgi:hypothetical protein
MGFQNILKIDASKFKLDLIDLIVKLKTRGEKR